MHHLSAVISVCILAIFTSLQTAQAMPGLAVNSPSASAGNSADLLFRLNNNGVTLATLQFELLFDPARGTPQGTQASTDALVSPICNVNGNRLTCILTLFGPPLPNDFTTRVPFHVTAGASGSFPLTLDFVEFGNSQGTAVPGTTSNGVFTILTTPPAVFASVPAPALIDFGFLTPAENANRQVLLQNIALPDASGLNISGCVVTGTGFTLNTPPTFPLSITAGNSQAISVRASASTTLETLTGSLRCNHSGAGSPAIWSLRAEVVSPLLFLNGFE